MASIDLSKLSSEPWRSVWQCNAETMQPTGKAILARKGTLIATFENGTDCEFAELARRAFGVMMRRGWWAIPVNCSEPFGWEVTGEWLDNNICKNPGDSLDCWPDPFTALVEADKWMTEQEDKAHE